MRVKMRAPRHLAELFLEFRIGDVFEIVGVSVNILMAVSHYVT
jgi:hypothetical protein